MKKFILFVMLLGSSIMYAQNWHQTGQNIYGDAAGDYLGGDVSNYGNGSNIDMSYSGDTMIVSTVFNDASGTSSGQAKVFYRSGNTWIQLGTDFVGDLANDQLGSSVAMSKDGATIAIGAHYDDGAPGLMTGIVRVYRWNGAAWVQLGANIDGEAIGDESGYAISLSDNGGRIAISARKNDGGASNGGNVRIFQWTGTNWNQLGTDIFGIIASEGSGNSVCISGNGNIVAVGSMYNDVNGTDAGKVDIYWYQWNGTQMDWVAYAGGPIYGSNPNDWFGRTLDLNYSGQTLIVGSSAGNNARVYNLYSGSRAQKGTDIYTTNGMSTVTISADGNRVAVGDPNYNSQNGRTRIYDWIGGIWSLDAEIFGTVNNSSGTEIALSDNGNRIAIGEPWDDTNGSNAGRIRVFNYCVTSASSINEFACGTYTVPSGDETYTSSGVYTDTIQNHHGCDSILTINLTINYTSTRDTAAIVCNSFGWNGTTYSASGIYLHTFTNAAGCDSVVTLNLTINNVNLSVTQTSNVLSADEPGATYQWINCFTMATINGATSQTYTVPANGDYAVIVTNNGCTDTSACYSVIEVGIIKNDFGNRFLIYPNPSDGNFFIDLGNIYQSIAITLTDDVGKVIQFNESKVSQLLVVKITEPAGIYLLKIDSGDKKALIRLLKE
jgi:hypothetical protein